MTSAAAEPPTDAAGVAGASSFQEREPRSAEPDGSPPRKIEEPVIHVPPEYSEKTCYLHEQSPI
jgi:hypothetical protein